MSVIRLCDIDRVPTATRLTLVRKVRDQSGDLKSRSMGGVDLCDACWTRICKPRMRSENPDWHQPGAQVCDRCGATSDVTRYTTKRSIRVGGVVTDIARGGLSLCRECWDKTARPRMREYTREARLHELDIVKQAHLTFEQGGTRAVRTRKP